MFTLSGDFGSFEYTPGSDNSSLISRANQSAPIRSLTPDEFAYYYGMIVSPESNISKIEKIALANVLQQDINNSVSAQAPNLTQISVIENLAKEIITLSQEDQKTCDFLYAQAISMLKMPITWNDGFYTGNQARYYLPPPYFQDKINLYLKMRNEKMKAFAEKRKNEDKQKQEKWGTRFEDFAKSGDINYESHVGKNLKYYMELSFNKHSIQKDLSVEKDIAAKTLMNNLIDKFYLNEISPLKALDKFIVGLNALNIKNKVDDVDKTVNEIENASDYRHPLLRLK
jgi:hypothetical protein